MSLITSLPSLRTMPLRSLRSLAGTGRRSPLRPAAGAADHRDDEVLLDVPDARLAPVLVAAAEGDHGPAAGLLAATRATSGWEDRDRYLTRLAAFALSRDEWLSGWLAASPHDPDALLLAAGLAVLRAWDSPPGPNCCGRSARWSTRRPTAIPGTRCRGASPWTTPAVCTPRTPASNPSGSRRCAAPRGTTAAMWPPCATCRRSGTARTPSASTSRSRPPTTHRPDRWCGHCRYGLRSRTSPAAGSRPPSGSGSTGPQTAPSRCPPGTGRATRCSRRSGICWCTCWSAGRGGPTRWSSSG